MQPERMILLSVQFVHGCHNCFLQIVNSFEIVVMDSRSLKVSPEALDEIQVRSVRGVPNDSQTIAVLFDVFSHRFGMMNGTIVQEHINMVAVGIDIFQQPMQEVEEFAATFFRGNHSRYFTGHGVKSAEYWNPTVLAGGWNDHSSATGRPTSRESGVEMELGLVTIRESTTTGAGFRFFKAARFCRLARAISFGSWRCFRSSLGQP